MSALLHRQADIEIVESDDYISTLKSKVAGGKTLLVTSPGFTSRGSIQNILDEISEVDLVIFDQVKPNPDIADLQKQADLYRDEAIHYIVALGGGSVIDSAKVLCALLENSSSSLIQLLSANKNVSKNVLQFIAIPTTSGTGSEVTPFATVWDAHAGKKYSLSGIIADTVILDANLTLTLRRNETLYPAMDALSHALESLWNKNRSTLSAEYAEQAIVDICEALPIVLAEPTNYSARRNLQIAACLAGLAIAETRTALAHAISYPLTAKHGMPHGLACSFTLAAIIRHIGAENLQIQKPLLDNVLSLLDKLDLAEDTERYLGWDTLIEETGSELDPSRAGNFIYSVDSALVENIIHNSKHTLQGKKTMEIKTLLFGAGPGAQRYIDRMASGRIFVGILDNDIKKVGADIFGLRVYSPGSVHELEFDEIIITTQWAMAVKHQLIDELGVETSKVIIPQKNQLKETLPFYNKHCIVLGRKIITEINSLALARSIPLVVDFGTLLGLSRDGDIIEWDDDIDFSAPKEFSTEVEDILTEFAKNNHDVSWRIDKITNGKGTVTSLLLRFTDESQVHDSFITSIAFRENRNGNSIHLPSVGMWFSPEIHFSEVGTIEWKGSSVQVPHLYKDYLTFQYGDWSKPKKNIKLTDYANLNVVTFSDIQSEGRQLTRTEVI